jgi:8-oxo-dGTP pyrophosphatase MutT (NUDIX family)
MGDLARELKQLDGRLFSSKRVAGEWAERVARGGLTKAENPESHVCVFFVPIRRGRREVFLVDHIKAGTWIAPGGHVEPGEGLVETIFREVDEELGVACSLEQVSRPFLVTVKQIAVTRGRRCRKHFDVWHTIEVEGELVADPGEFYGSGWFGIDRALVKVTDKNNRLAMKKLARMM